MATIRIADPIRPTRSNESTAASNIVHPTRAVSLDRRSTRSRGRRASLDRRSVKSGDPEGAQDEDSGLRQAGDFKKRQVSSRTRCLYTPQFSCGLDLQRKIFTMARISIHWVRILPQPFLLVAGSYLSFGDILLNKLP